MTDKEVKVKISTEVDKSEVDDLEEILQQMQDNKVVISPEVESMELDEVEARIEELEQKRADIYMGVDDSDLEEVETELEELEQRRIELTGDVDISGIEEASQGFSDLEQQADSTTSALETMAMLDIASTLSQWGSQAESFAQELDDIAISTEQLAIQTGMTDAEMTGMLNNITNATFPRDQALMYVQSLDQIGVASENLGASATGLDRINDAFHMGAPAVNKLGQELSVLGVDMNDVSSSFNALAYANANTVGGMENFSKFLTRFDSQFHELGLNVDQAAVAIAGATHKFGGGRAALTGMSDALKNCNGDLSVLEQELGLEAGALSNASQLTGQYAGQLDAMADKEAKHKTWTQQIAAALDDVTASLNGALSPFASFIGMVGNAGSFAVGINGLIQLANTIKNVEMVQNALNKVQEADILLKARSTAASIAHTVAETARTVATKAVAVAQALLNAVMLANPVLLVVAAIVALIAILWYCYNTNEEFRNSVNQLFDDLKRLASGDWHVVVEYEKKGVDAGVDTVGNLANNDISRGIFGGLFGDEAMAQADEQMPIFLENIKTRLHEGMDAFWNDGTQGFLGWLGQISGIDIMPYLQGVWNGFMTIPQWVNQAEQQTVQAFQSMLGQVGSILDNIGARASSFGSSLISNLGSAASSAVSSFASGLSGLVSAAWAEFNDVLNAIYDFGRQAIEAARGIGQQITNAIWQRNSPGIVAHATFDEMEDSYKFLKMGLENMVPLTSTYSKEIVDAYNPNLNVDFGSGAVSGVSGGAGTVINNEFNFTFTDFIDDKERLTDLIIKTITDEINWNNTTANRTI